MVVLFVVSGLFFFFWEILRLISIMAAPSLHTKEECKESPLPHIHTGFFCWYSWWWPFYLTEMNPKVTLYLISLVANDVEDILKYFLLAIYISAF